MLQSLNDVVIGDFAWVSTGLDIKCFQLIANLIVKNEWSKEKIWNFMGDVILTKLKSDDSAFVNVAAMIVYNIIISKNPELDKQQILKICLDNYRKFLNEPTNHLPDFVSILMDFLICGDISADKTYKELEINDQRTALYYIHDYIENESNA